MEPSTSRTARTACPDGPEEFQNSVLMKKVFELEFCMNFSTSGQGKFVGWEFFAASWIACRSYGEERFPARAS